MGPDAVESRSSTRQLRKRAREKDPKRRNNEDYILAAYSTPLRIRRLQRIFISSRDIIPRTLILKRKSGFLWLFWMLNLCHACQLFHISLLYNKCTSALFSR